MNLQTILLSVCLLALYGCTVIAATVDGVTCDRDAVRKREQLIEQNFLVGISSLGALHENNTQCGQELEMLLEAISKQELWTLKVLDNFGAAPTSFIWGNNHWFRRPDYCNDLNQPYTISLEHSQPMMFNATSPFLMQFVVLYLNASSPYTIDVKWQDATFIHMGLCLPKSCDLYKIQTFAQRYFQSKKFEMQQRFKLEMEIVEVRAPHFSRNFFKKPAVLAAALLIFVFISLAILAEIVHRSRQKLHLQHLAQQKMTFDNHIPAENTQKITNNFININDFSSPKQCELKSSTWEKLLMCFNVRTNYATVMSLENSNRNAVFLSSVSGIRCIICMWITMFHVNYHAQFATANKSFVFALLENFIMQPIPQAMFFVDIFFIISSFLLVYNFLSNAKEMERISAANCWQNMKSFFRTVMHRYFRLTLVVVFSILLSTLFVDGLNMFSAFRIGDDSGFYCKNNWWYNLLYIQNFLDMNIMCCNWTWYLACEMQYFILFTGLLYLYAKYPISAKILYVVLSLGFVATAGILNYYNGITFQLDVVQSTLNNLYVKPWVRIPPYLGGAAMGWLMYTLQKRYDGHSTITEKQQKLQLETPTSSGSPPSYPIGNTWSRKIFWILCSIVVVAACYMSYWRATPTWAVATIMSVGKLLFALCIGGLIVMCAFGRGGILNAMLSSRPFLFLSKFCYSIYMLAPLVILICYGGRNEPTNFTIIGTGFDYISVIAYSTAGAILLYALGELPMQKVSNILWRS